MFLVLYLDNRLSVISGDCVSGFVSVVVWLLEFYVLTTYKVMSGYALTGDSAYSWWVYSAAPTGTYHLDLISHQVTIS